MRRIEAYIKFYARKHQYFTNMRLQLRNVVARGPGLLRSYKTAAFPLCNRHASVSCTKDLGLGKIRVDRYQRSYEGKYYEARLIRDSRIMQHGIRKMCSSSSERSNDENANCGMQNQVSSENSDDSCYNSSELEKAQQEEQEYWLKMCSTQDANDNTIQPDVFTGSKNQNQLYDGSLSDN